jgi:hypothetical protein
VIGVYPLLPPVGPMRAENIVSPVMTAGGHGLRVSSSGRSKSEVEQSWSLLLLKLMRISSIHTQIQHRYHVHTQVYTDIIRKPTQIQNSTIMWKSSPFNCSIFSNSSKTLLWKLEGARLVSPFQMLSKKLQCDCLSY